MEWSYFDTAVREACLLLESQIKIWLGSKKWGDRLVEELISKLREEDKILESELRIFRGHIRSAFKFIRNHFMHNLVEIDEIQCRAILFRLVRIKSALNSLLAST